MNKNWIHINKNLFEFDTEEKESLTSRTFGEKINCDECGKIILPKNQHEWEVYLKKTRLSLENGGTFAIKTTVKFYCLDCKTKLNY